MYTWTVSVVCFYAATCDFPDYSSRRTVSYRSHKENFSHADEPLWTIVEYVIDEDNEPV